MRFTVSALIVLCFVVGSHAYADEGKTSFKGWELYILPDGNEWKFSLLPGTNRLKSDDEIDKAAVKGLDAIKKKLDELKSGEEVFISGDGLFKAPPKDVADELSLYGQKRDLKMHVKP